METQAEVDNGPNSMKGVSICHSSRRYAPRVSASKGYFSPADPNAEIRPLRKRKEFDITKRGGMADFIWNTDWESQLDYEEQLKQEAKERDKEENQAPSGFLSLARTASLNDLSVDMSEKLKSKSDVPSHTSQASRISQTQSVDERPSQKEVNSWARSRRYAIDPIAMDVDIDKKQSREADMERYAQEQSEIRLWNAALITISFCSVYAAYSKVAVGYLVGAIGGSLYFRLLKKSIDGLGQGGLATFSSQPRLLIPVLLVMGCNRWNALVAEDVGLHLELLPMFVGFFTYKAAVVGRQSLELFRTLVADVKR